MNLGNKIKTKKDLFEVIDKIIPLPGITCPNEVFITNEQVYCSVEQYNDLLTEFENYKRLKEIKSEIDDILK